MYYTYLTDSLKAMKLSTMLYEKSNTSAINFSLRINYFITNETKQKCINE